MAIACAVLFLFLGTVVTLLSINARVQADRKNEFLGMATINVRLSLKKSNLPAPQQARMLARVEKVEDDYREGRITSEQVSEIFSFDPFSPIIPAGSLYHLHEQRVQKSGLNEEEKRQGKRAIDRATRALMEKRIPTWGHGPILEPIMEPNAGADWTKVRKDKITDADIRELLKRADALANEKSIPDEAFPFDAADAFDTFLDEAVKKALR